MHNHTLLVNKALLLAIVNEGGQPSTLHDCGYRVHAIERGVRVGDRAVVPDIMFLNEGEGHMLVVDCKGGANIKPDQDARYAQMRLEEILESSRPPCEVRSRTFAYAVNEEHVGRMREHTHFALIVFGSHAFHGIGDFGRERLTAELRAGAGLGYASNPRYAPYPFSINDTHKDIDAAVVAAIQSCQRALPGMRLQANRATADEVLRAAHPFHEKFAPAHRTELVDVVRLSIERVLARRAPRWF